MMADNGPAGAGQDRSETPLDRDLDADRSEMSERDDVGGGTEADQAGAVKRRETPGDDDVDADRSETSG